MGKGKEVMNPAAIEKSAWYHSCAQLAGQYHMNLEMLACDLALASYASEPIAYLPGRGQIPRANKARRHQHTPCASHWGYLTGPFMIMRILCDFNSSRGACLSMTSTLFPSSVLAPSSIARFFKIFRRCFFASRRRAQRVPMGRVSER